MYVPGINILSGFCSELQPANGYYNPFPTFSFTGTLRPVYPLSPRREVPASIQRPDYTNDGIPKSERKLLGRHKITILDEKGQAAMRKVCALAREVLDIAAREIRPGVTTDHIDEVVHKACIARDVSWCGISFPCKICSISFRRESEQWKGYLPGCANVSSHTRHHSTTTIFPNPSAPLQMKSSVTVSRIIDYCLMATFSTLMCHSIMGVSMEISMKPIMWVIEHGPTRILFE